MLTASQKLEKMRCEFTVDNEFWQCEECRAYLPDGSTPFFVSDGGMEPRDGSYLCEQCARQLCQ